MMTTHHNERSTASFSNNNNNTPRNATIKNVADLSMNYSCTPGNRAYHGNTNEDTSENIYSRPIELAQSHAKLIGSSSNSMTRDVMTASCPSASLLRHSELSHNDFSGLNGGPNGSERLSFHPNQQGQNHLKGEEIYSNGISGVGSIVSSVPKTSDRPYSALINQSPPPRPPSLLRRNKPMNTSPHHHHYYHHQRDSGHASIGSSEDLSLAPPLPPRYSCKSILCSLIH